MHPDKLTSSLLAHMQSSSSADRPARLGLLQQWLKLNIASWNAHLRNRWRLDELAEMELSRYPIEDASLDLDDELRQLKSVPPTSMELMAMRIRDILWAGITVESKVVCPRCGEAQLRILEDALSDTIVLSCDLCAWSQTPQGQPWHGAGDLKPVWRHAGG